MDKRTREIYNDQILIEALRRYGIDRDAVHALYSFENYVYEYTKGGKAYILRISHSLRRSPEMIAGEVEWIKYLADNGVRVACVVPSIDGNLVEVVDAGETCFPVVSFEKARGAYAKTTDWDNGLMVKLGCTMGRMHALTRNYMPSDPRFKRSALHESAPGFAEKYLSPSDVIIIAKYNTLLQYIARLPIDLDAYGLIHTDMHDNNFFVEAGEILLFDFDDSEYAWFVYDIAMALFYILPHDCVGAESIMFARKMLNQLLEGYSREYTLASEWLKQIPYFLKLREIVLYISIHRSCDLGNLDPWCASFMENRKYKLEHDVPYLCIDFL